MDALELKAKLYRKKAKARATIETLSITKDGYNKHSNYNYISEANYKTICKAILKENGLELKSSIVSVERFTGLGKLSLGVGVVEEYELIDIDTGYGEKSQSAGDGVDNGDKSIYKAMTGSFKYFMANNFQITTGDDAEKVDNTYEPKQPLPTQEDVPPNYNYKVEAEKKNLIKLVTEGAKIFKCTPSMLKKYHVKSIEQMTLDQLKEAKATLDEKG